MKRRTISKGLIIIAADSRQLDDYVWYPSRQIKDRVAATWPGPVTWLLPARGGVPVWLRGRHRSLAVRVTAHPIARALARGIGALVSTSANTAGCAPARKPARVRAYFNGAIDYLVPGEIGEESGPTLVIDAIDGEIVRSATI